MNILAGIGWLLQFLVVLVTGKRMSMLTNLHKTYVSFVTKMGACFMIVADERPPIIPESN